MAYRAPVLRANRPAAVRSERVPGFQLRTATIGDTVRNGPAPSIFRASKSTIPSCQSARSDAPASNGATTTVTASGAPTGARVLAYKPTETAKRSRRIPAATFRFETRRNLRTLIAREILDSAGACSAHATPNSLAL